jgi:CRP/FNR family transcriptional regulator
MAKVLSLLKGRPKPKGESILGSDPPPNTPAPSDPLLTLVHSGGPEEFPTGVTLFRQGHHPNVLWYIESGLVKTVRTVGAADALVSPRGPGWVLGLAAAYLSAPYSTSGITARPCILRAIQPQDFRAAIEASPALAAIVLDRALAQARRDEIQRAEMAVLPAPDRLALILMRLAALIAAPVRDGRAELALPITHNELAQLVGVSREHLSRLFATFEITGKLNRRRGVLLLPLARWPQLARNRAATL